MAARSTRLMGFTPGTAMAVVAAVFGAFLLRNAFVAAHRTVGWVVACSVVALLVEPVVGLLERFLPRWLSVIVVLIGVVTTVVVVVFALTNELLDSLLDLEEAAPDAARGLEERFDWAADVGVAERVERIVREIRTGVSDATLDRAVRVIPTYLVTGILMLFLLGWGPRYIAGFLGQFDDEERRERWRAVIERTTRRGRTYLLCTVAHAAATGIFFGTVCWLLDLPAPFGLGLAMAAMAPIPLIGMLVGGIPATLLAFGDESWGTAITVLFVVIGLQVVEAGIVRPWVDARTLRLGPTVPIMAGLLGFELYGAGGAAYAIALSVLGLAALDAVGWVQGDDPHPEILEASGITADPDVIAE
jgi:predicted PurR-regulated permease PerM